MGKLARALALIAPRRLLRLERFQPSDPRLPQLAGIGGAGETQPLGDLGVGHSERAAKMLGDGAQVVGMAVPGPGGRARAI
ncbi:MAG: hypothetical protein AAGM38_00350 [Pseudomonadota bacterium]